MRQKQLLSLFLVSLLAFLLVTPLLPSASVLAATSSIQDEAALLESSEITTLDAMITNISNTSNINVRIFTVDTLNGKNGTVYLDELEDKLSVEHAVFLLIDMSIDNPSNRAYYINTFDELNQTYFNQDRRDAIRDAAIKQLSKGNYYEGLRVSLELIEKYSKTSIRTDSILFQSWFQLVIALAVSGIVVFFMAYTSGGKETTTSATYLQQETSGVLGHYDHYLYTTTRRVKREKDNGGDNTHTTSGGHSSGSSSGHF